ncbi:hypothetical protein ACFXG4_37950 [Nocardia sp. NPDC059246]
MADLHRFDPEIGGAKTMSKVVDRSAVDNPDLLDWFAAVGVTLAIRVGA